MNKQKKSSIKGDVVRPRRKEGVPRSAGPWIGAVEKFTPTPLLFLLTKKKSVRLKLMGDPPSHCFILTGKGCMGARTNPSIGPL